MTLSIVLLLGGVLLLYLGAEWLIRGAAELGVRFGLNPLVIGLTVVSVGTSAPELIVCIVAVLQGSPDIVMGNVLGSNLANVGLILGLAALVGPLAVAEPVVRRDVPWMLAVTLLSIPLMWNLHMGRLEGLLMIAVLTLYLVRLAPDARTEGGVVVEAVGGGLEPKRKDGSRGEGLRGIVVPIALILVGALALVGGGQGIVRGATRLALDLGISELIIGLSMVAIGTSLPELATTLVAAARKETDMAVGNIVGSNIFNLTLVLGGTALVRPFAVTPHILTVELPATFLVSFLLLLLVVHRQCLGRWKGAMLLLSYAGAWVWIYFMQ